MSKTERRVQTTKIEKKWTDKKTGEKKSMTIDYAKVKDRLKEFREECANGDIDTQVTFTNGKVLVKAVILKDRAKADETARGTGHAVGDSQDEKGLEKTETLAVGRALAMLGYGADGAIASSEEMEEYGEYLKEKKQELILSMTERLDGVKSLEELKTAWAEVPAEVKKDLETKKDEMKAILTSVASEAL